MATVKGTTSGRIHASAFDGAFVPSAESILLWASEVANRWQWLAILWHLGLASLLFAIVSGWSSPRLVAALLWCPIVSVAILAWVSGNPFNGLAFSLLAVVLLTANTCVPDTAVTHAWPGWRLAGVALVALGWVYPHFLKADAWTAYLYASPFGLLPCPTLSAVIGVTLIHRGLQSSAWSLPLVAAGLLYGLIGVFRLRMVLDLPLLAGSILLGTLTAANLVRRGGATDGETRPALAMRR